MKGKTKSSPEATLVIVNNSPESLPAKSPSVRNNKGASASALKSSSSSNDETASSSPVNPPFNPQADVVESPDNERSESASTVQIASQNMSGGAQPSTPRTPNTPSDHGATTPNPPTPGNTAIVTCPSPSYVTISGDGTTTATSTRSYTSLTPVNSTGGVDVDHEEGLGGNSTSYPVYTVGDTGTMYNSASNHYFSTTSATNSGITYAQESGVAYLVPTTNANNNNNSNNTANANLESDGQPNISHATRVSPATSESEETSRKRHSSMPRELAEGEEWTEDFERLFDDDEDVGGTLGFMGDDIEDHVVMLTGDDIPRPGGSRGTHFPSDNFLATLKSCPITVQWLLENYETAEGVSLPRSTLYYHYLRHCTEHKLDPVNAASFGKLIRSVFLGLRTRRLGTRGNSKYHYYGIRLKPDSPLNGIDDSLFEEQALAAYNRSHANGVSHSNTSPRTMVGMHSSNHNPPSIKRAKTSRSLEHGDGINGLSHSETLSLQSYLGDTSHALENLPELDLTVPVPDGLLQDDLLVFRTLYREHCSELLADIIHFQLQEFQKRLKLFWRATSDGTQSNGIDQCEFDNVLPKTKLHALCTMKEVQNYVRRTDYKFYQSIVTILLPDVLRPIPATMTQTIRNFAKGLEGCLTIALAGYPEEVVAVKLSVVSAFSQTLRRYTSLNHLAQAARAVLQNQNQITQMLSDLNRVDFHNVEEQASWVCGCNEEIVPELEADFKATLGQQQSLEEWASWLEGVVDRVLSPYANAPKYPSVARTFLLKWSFYSSLVIRDLTLRSAASFGSFHLLRLLYDEYMFYLIENRVAQETGVVPISVIGKKTNNRLSFEPSRNNIDADMSESQTHGIIKI